MDITAPTRRRNSRTGPPISDAPKPELVQCLFRHAGIAWEYDSFEKTVAGCTPAPAQALDTADEEVKKLRKIICKTRITKSLTLEQKDRAARTLLKAIDRYHTAAALLRCKLLRTLWCLAHGKVTAKAGRWPGNPPQHEIHKLFDDISRFWQKRLGQAKTYSTCGPFGRFLREALDAVKRTDPLGEPVKRLLEATKAMLRGQPSPGPSVASRAKTWPPKQIQVCKKLLIPSLTNEQVVAAVIGVAHRR